MAERATAKYYRMEFLCNGRPQIGLMKFKLERGDFVDCEDALRWFPEDSPLKIDDGTLKASEITNTEYEQRCAQMIKPWDGRGRFKARGHA